MEQVPGAQGHGSDASAQEVPKHIFESANTDLAIRQGEVVSGVLATVRDPSSGKARSQRHPYAVVISQDCDLDQDFAARRSSAAANHLWIPTVLLIEAAEEKETREQGVNADVMRRIAKHQLERFQLIQACPAELDALRLGVPELILDFKRFFTLARDDLYAQLSVQRVDSGARRYHLRSPYRDHLQNKFAFYLARVGLPEQHESL